MEEKKKGKGLKVLIVVLVVLLLAALGYIAYDKGCFDRFKNNDKDITKNNVNVPEPKKEIKFEGAKVIEEDINDGEADYVKYLVAKINGEWKELDKEVTLYFGEKDNKLYYSTNEYFKYIDLNSEDLEPVEWIKFEEKDYASGHFIGYLQPDVGLLKGDTIYYHVGSLPDKIRTLKITATKYSDIKKVATTLGEYGFYLNDDNTLFYQEFIEGNANNRLVSYNLNTNERKVLISKNVEMVNFYKDKAVVLTQKNKKDEYVYKMYLYDFNTMENKFIDKTDDYIGDFVDGAIYYVIGNNAVKYENGKTSTIYEYDPPSEDDEYAVRGIIPYNKNLLRYSLGSGDNDFYVADGKRIGEKEAQTLMEKYEVTMKDGSVKTFYESDCDDLYIETYSEKTIDLE